MIRAVKWRYRQKLMAHYLEMFNCGVSSSISLLDCMVMLRAAWKAVPTELICKCFEACNLRTMYATENTALKDTSSDMQDLWQQGKTAGCVKEFFGRAKNNSLRHCATRALV